MKIIGTIKTMKKVYPGCIVMVKVGNFYYVYSKDSYILSYLFDYRLKESEGYPSCGFPVASLDKVKGILEISNLNYIILNNSKDIEPSEKDTSHDNSIYEETYKIAEKSVLKSMRIQKIYESLQSQLETEDLEEKLTQIERILERKPEAI